MSRFLSKRNSQTNNEAIGFVGGKPVCRGEWSELKLDGPELFGEGYLDMIWNNLYRFGDIYIKFVSSKDGKTIRKYELTKDNISTKEDLRKELKSFYENRGNSRFIIGIPTIDFVDGEDDVRKETIIEKLGEGGFTEDEALKIEKILRKNNLLINVDVTNAQPKPVKGEDAITDADNVDEVLGLIENLRDLLEGNGKATIDEIEMIRDEAGNVLSMEEIVSIANKILDEKRLLSRRNRDELLNSYVYPMYDIAKEIAEQLDESALGETASVNDSIIIIGGLKKEMTSDELIEKIENDLGEADIDFDNVYLRADRNPSVAVIVIKKDDDEIDDYVAEIKFDKRRQMWIVPNKTLRFI